MLYSKLQIGCVPKILKLSLNFCCKFQITLKIYEKKNFFYEMPTNMKHGKLNKQKIILKNERVEIK